MRRTPGLGGLALGVAGAVVMLLWVGADGYKQTLVTTTATYALLLVALVFFAFKPQGLFTRRVRA